MEYPPKERHVRSISMLKYNLQFLLNNADDTFTFSMISYNISQNLLISKASIHQFMFVYCPCKNYFDSVLILLLYVIFLKLFAEIFYATSAHQPRADVSYCIHKLSKRLSKTRSWIVNPFVHIHIHLLLKSL